MGFSWKYEVLQISINVKISDHQSSNIWKLFKFAHHPLWITKQDSRFPLFLITMNRIEKQFSTVFPRVSIYSFQVCFPYLMHSSLLIISWKQLLGNWTGLPPKNNRFCLFHWEANSACHIKTFDRVNFKGPLMLWTDKNKKSRHVFCDTDNCLHSAWTLSSEEELSVSPLQKANPCQGFPRTHISLLLAGKEPGNSGQVTHPKS